PLDFSTPKANEDAGRLRDDAFFAEMYGENEAEVRKNLVPIYWAPSGRTVMFNKVNGAAEKLETVGRELAADFNLKSYAAKTAGTFNYRFI
ncbi:M15 family metallopeptidase, partial [Neisseria sp. P0014.S004]